MLYLGVPAIVYFTNSHRGFLIILWSLCFAAQFILQKFHNFNIKHTLLLKLLKRKSLKNILILYAISCIVIFAYTYFFENDLFLGFVSNRPYLWLAVMFLYPIFSVYPQEVIFRVYFFERYKNLLPRNCLLLLNTILFGFAHIIFGNYISVILCVIGGYLFAKTYLKTNSLLLVCIEHAIYGDLIFTAGLGRYFYQGAVGIN